MKKKTKSNLATFFAVMVILFAIGAVGSIEDCGGACAGNDNWFLFTIMSVSMIVSGVLSIYFQSEVENENF
tara:strand:+ start:893 stop:1105 length:213 start_codon:yes stop_codon:yes gene_type:complete